MRGQGGGGDRGPAVDPGLADLQGPRRRPLVELRAADARRRRDRPRPHDRAGVLLRVLHALAHPRRDAQPVEPGVRRRRLVRRRGRGAGVGHDDDRLGLRHRRLDPRPGVVQRRRRLQAAVRPRAAGRRRSTTTPTATAGRWPGRSPTPRSTRTRWPGRRPTTSSRCGPSTCCRPTFDGDLTGMRIAVTGRLRDVAGRPRDPPTTRSRSPRRCGPRAPQVDVVDLVAGAGQGHARRRDPLPASASAPTSSAEAAAHPDLVTDYAAAFARDARRAGRGRLADGEAHDRGRAVRAGRRAAGDLRRADLPDARHARLRRRRVLRRHTGSTVGGVDAATTRSARR